MKGNCNQIGIFFLFIAETGFDSKDTQEILEMLNVWCSCNCYKTSVTIFIRFVNKVCILYILVICYSKLKKATFTFQSPSSDKSQAILLIAFPSLQNCHVHEWLSLIKEWKKNKKKTHTQTQQKSRKSLVLM